MTNETPTPGDAAAAATRFMQDMGEAWMRAVSPAAPKPEASAAAAAAAFLPTPEMAKQMQQAMLKAMADYAEHAMRSPEFLEAMQAMLRQSLDLRRQMDAFLQQNLKQQMPGSRDEQTAAVAAALLRVERKLDDLIDRVDRLESSPRPGA